MEDDRRVASLRLKAASRSDVNRGADLVAEALAAASLPGMGPRGVLLVRRLDLGRFGLSRQPRHLAGRITRRLLALNPVRIATEEMDDDRLPAVWFADRSDACMLLGRRIASGEAPRAWYWRRAVPSWPPQADAPTGLKAILTALLSARDGPRAAAAFLDTLILSGWEAPLLNALNERDGIGLARTAGLPAAREKSDRRASGKAAALFEALAPPWRNALVRWFAGWGAADARSAWLASMGAGICHPTTSGQTILYMAAHVGSMGSVKVSGASRPPIGEPRDALPGVTAGRGAVPQGPEETAPAAGPQLPESSAGPREGAVHFFQPEKASRRPEAAMVTEDHRPGPLRPAKQGAALTGDVRTDDLAASQPQHKTDRRPWSDTGEQSRGAAPPKPDGYFEIEGASVSSEWAGFAFLINVLRCLGLEALMADVPAWGEINPGAQILWNVAEKLEIAVEDPVLAFLPTPPLLDLPAPREAADRPDSGGTLPWPAPRISGVECPGGGPSAWVAAADAMVAKKCRKDLAEVLRRPGRLWLTPVHLDIRFSMDRVDLDIRKAGLDVDPGWVPWLGRVVRFHYGEHLEHNE